MRNLSLLDRNVLAAEDSIERANERIFSSQLALINFEAEADKTKKDIVERVFVIVNALNEKKDAYLKSIDEHRFKESQKLKQEILDSETATENGQEALYKVKNSIAGENNVMLLESFSDITKTLRTVVCVSRMKTIPPRVQFHPVTKPEAEKLIGNLNLTKQNSIIEEVDPVNLIKSTTAIKEGDRVRVKPSIKNPKLGWGGVSHQSIGIVLSIQKCNITVNFSEISTWDGYLSEVELA
ncbi:HERC2 [Mytilus edulis]|uniref:HERC2 n=1 Tax=Mytilus edulis TaxID=6550 RepID=A0A8S3PM79_MYTED|nr:HERC2 [Mytilus edulis]